MSERSVNRLLHAPGYSLQANRKALEGRQHAERNGQFRYIDERVREFQGAGQPLVSVDTKICASAHILVTVIHESTA